MILLTAFLYASKLLRNIVYSYGIVYFNELRIFS